VLYCLERELCHRRFSCACLFRRHWYAFPPTGAGVYSTVIVPYEGTGIAAVYTLSLIEEKQLDPVFSYEQERITNTFFSCTLAVNSICTGTCTSSFPSFVGWTGADRFCVIFHESGLIAYRIWLTQRQTRDAKMGSNLSRVSIIVIESGALIFSSGGGARCPYLRLGAGNRCHLPDRIGMQRVLLCAQIQPIQHLPGYSKDHFLPPS